MTTDGPEKEIRKYQREVDSLKRKLCAKEDYLEKIQILYHQRVEDVEKATRDIVRKNRELEELANDLKQQKEVAENATQLKDKFVALVSHDLRSPLASLVQHIKVLESGTAGFTKEELTHFHRAIIGNCESMMNLIDRLLNLSRIRSGKIVLDRVQIDLKALVNEVYGSMAHLAKGKNLSLDNRLPETARVNADCDLFAEVIRNLLSNAIKFSSQGGIVSAYEPGDGAQLAVRDCGMGIPASMLPDLFTGEKKTNRPGTAGEQGTGFGLPLCREIMELHGGRISAESVEGKRSVFYLRLPVK